MEESIAKKIKQLRSSAGWTQSELARQSGVTGAAISIIEKGDRNPTLDISRKIAKALNISVAELTGDSLTSSIDMNSKTQSFFRKFGDIAKLSNQDQQLILSIVRRLKGK